MAVPSEVRDWIARSEVDHVGPFVNAWAAFNAWYRHVAGTAKDRDGLNFVRTQPNSVRGAILPLLNPENSDTPVSVEFRTAIGALHGALDGFRLETVNDAGVTEHVSFRSVPLNRRQQLPQTSSGYGITYSVNRVSGVWISVVKNGAGTEIARIEQLDYDETDFAAHGDFMALSHTQQGRFRALYADCNPRPTVNLLTGAEPPIKAGTIEFRCADEDLFGGVIETIYRMRNMLLHGELKPDPQALACYAPAYYILRRLLQECR